MAVQLAGAGVNAHINFDLAVATVDTGRELGDADLAGRRDDYDKVNDVFAENMDALLDRLLEEQEGRRRGPRAAVGPGPADDPARRRRPPVRLGGRRRPVGTPPRLRRLGGQGTALDAVASLVGRGVLVDLPG